MESPFSPNLLRSPKSLLDPRYWLRSKDVEGRLLGVRASLIWEIEQEEVNVSECCERGIPAGTLSVQHKYDSQ